MSSDLESLAAARAGNQAAFETVIAPYRRELKAHCYRMSASIHDADDLLQESLLKAWRSISGFEGRSSLRTWLYTVTTSICLDAAERRAHRVIPTGLGAPATPGGEMVPSTEALWIEPCPDELLVDGARGPEARYGARESIALAFLAALQLLPPKQRAVLILRDVLGWQAAECAELLELSVASVNSALQRARDTLSRSDRQQQERSAPADEGIRDLLSRYVRAWETSDVTSLVALLRDDAVLSMPPFASWFKGPHDIGASLAGMVLMPGSAGFFKLVPIHANGQYGFAMYAKDAPNSPFSARSIQVVEVFEGRIAEITAFLDPSLFAPFGLPPTTVAARAV